MPLTILRARRLAVSTLAAVLGLAASAATGLADTTVKWMHIETNPEHVAYWKERVAAFEEAHPGVKIEMQFLDNEAYKAKLPTLLQSEDPPDIFYSWAGGVLQAQADAGVLKNIASDMKKDGWGDTYNPAALKAFTYKDGVWGVPYNLSEIAFYYNKKLFREAGIDAAKINTWNDFLDAVKALKAAGITPIAVGGADKWPVHFYWVYLVLRGGGEPAITAAKVGEGEGFAGEPFVTAGEHFRELAALEPFQPGYLAAKWPAFLGQFADGKAAMVLAFSAITVKLQALNATDKKGLPLDEIGMFHFPVVEGGAGRPTDTMGGVNGWLLWKDAPPEAVAFLRFLTNEENQRVLAERNLHIPAQKGAETSVKDPLLKEAAAALAGSTYHQNFFDQDLGPAVGRVVNDVTTDLAAGEITPEEAAQAIEEAWELEH
jgi:raffinose/stachyose/melibiose transport system substrate-binding protein